MYAIMRQLRNAPCMKFMISVCTSLHTALNNPKHPKLFINLSILETFQVSILKFCKSCKILHLHKWLCSAILIREMDEKRGIRNGKKSKQKVLRK